MTAFPPVQPFPPRKIIQIAVVSAEGNETVYALRDDGTIWYYQWASSGNGWHRMIDPPA